MKLLPISISLGLMLSFVNPIFANGGSVGGLAQEDFQALKKDSQQNNSTLKDTQASNTEQEQVSKHQSVKQ